LRYVESASQSHPSGLLGKDARSALVLPIQTTGLMLGDAIISILCLNKHKGNRLILSGAQNSKKCDDRLKL
jgi:hypothetical protein